MVICAEADMPVKAEDYSLHARNLTDGVKIIGAHGTERGRHMLDQLKEIVAEQLNVDADTITEETSFIDDLGADSLDIMEMVMQLEDTFNISIPTEDAGKLQTVGLVIAYLKENGAEE